MVIRPFIAAQADTHPAASLPVAHLPDEPVSLGAASPLRAALLAQVGATACERVVMAARCPLTGRPMVLARFGAADFLMTPADADHQARVLDTECLPGKPGHALALQISSQLWNAVRLCHAVEQHANANSSPLGGGGPSPQAMVEGVFNDPEPPEPKDCFEEVAALTRQSITDCWRGPPLRLGLTLRPFAAVKLEMMLRAAQSELETIAKESGVSISAWRHEPPQ